MADEDSITPPASNVLEASTAAAEPAPVAPAVEPAPAVAAAEEAPPVSVAENADPTGRPAPSAAAHAGRYEEPHSESHPHFRWHADVLVDGHDVYQGMVKDISMRGVNLLVDHNLQGAKFVKLHIHVPPLDLNHPHDVLEVSGKIISTVYDCSEAAFRSGISFIQFTLDSDRTYLQSRLSGY